MSANAAACHPVYRADQLALSFIELNLLNLINQTISRRILWPREPDSEGLFQNARLQSLSKDGRQGVLNV